MTNFEKYKDEIFEIAKNTNCMPAVVNGMPCYCETGVCTYCDFSNEVCSVAFVKWGYARYIEISKLSKSERALCEALQRGWICRDADESLCYFTTRPYKYEESCNWDVKNDGDYVNLCVLGFESSFPFIKWEDEELWSIEKLLELEVKE